MIEDESKEIPLDILKKAFEIGQEEINRSCDFQLDFLSMLDITEKEVMFNKPSHELEEEVKNFI
jgi:polyribonucleotide nucleotidyltransferase